MNKFGISRKTAVKMLSATADQLPPPGVTIIERKRQTKRREPHGQTAQGNAA